MRHELQYSQFEGGERTVQRSVMFPEFNIQAIREETGEVLLTTRRSEGELPLPPVGGIALHLVGSRLWMSAAAVPAVFCESESDGPHVVVPHLLGHVRCLDFTERGNPKVVWSINDFGSSGSKGVCIGIAAEGRHTIAMVSSTPEGVSCVEQRDA